MKPLMLEEVITALEGSPDRPIPVASVSRVVTDSRAVKPGDLFVAIRGERFDGHDFINEVFAAGALAAVVRNDFDRVLPENSTDAGNGVLVRVDDPIEAMGRLTLYYRRSVIAGTATVVAVTGSVGKTTTKEMITHVLSARYKGVGSPKSYNNNIGVPLTLLSVEPQHSFVICEVGMNAPGEIAMLARLVEPELAVITNVVECHLEKLGSLERIAEEKLSLLRHLRPDGAVVVNFDSPVLKRSVEKERAYRKIKRVSFGQSAEADLRLTDVVVAKSGAKEGEAAGPGNPETAPGFEFTINNRFVYRLNVPGRHNVINALAAIGVARWFGMDHDEIARQLATFTLPAMRLQMERAGEWTIINDAYNANPASVAAALDVLLDTPVAGRRVLILGDMRELGTAAEELHRRSAERIGMSAVDVVIAIGDFAKLVAKTIETTSQGRIETHVCASTAASKRRVPALLKPADTILVKGSRALGLEKLIDVLRRGPKPAHRRGTTPARRSGMKQARK